MCLPIIYLINENLKIEKNDSEFSKTLKKVLSDSVEFYCNKYNLTRKKEYIAATFLDPRFKKFSKMPEKENDLFSKDAKKYIKEYLESNPIASQIVTQSPTQVDNNEPPKKKILNAFDFETTPRSSKNSAN